MTSPRELADDVLAAPARLGETRLLCIDGPAGSGKTTLAADVQAALRAQASESAVALLHMDDLYEGWDGLDERLEARVLAQLLQPLAAGASARWQRYDWHASRFADWHDLVPPDVLILEGCGSGAVAYAEYRSLLVWIEAPPDERIARGMARDGEAVLPHWLAWMRSEEAHFAKNRTKDHADVVLSSVG